LAHDAAASVVDDDVVVVGGVGDAHAVAVVAVVVASVGLAVVVVAIVPSVEVEACAAVAVRLMPSDVATLPTVTASSRCSIGMDGPKRRQSQTQAGAGSENKHETAAAPVDVAANEIGGEDVDRTKLTWAYRMKRVGRLTNNRVTTQRLHSPPMGVDSSPIQRISAVDVVAVGGSAGVAC